MTPAKLTTTRIREGIWQGVLTRPGSAAPNIEVTHRETPVTNVEVVENGEGGTWALSVPIPAQAISDGVQTLVIRDVDADLAIGHITLMAGEVLGDDIRAEMDLLRAELDMLKRAFRRHCTETA